MRLLHLVERVTLLSELKSGSMLRATLPCEIESLLHSAVRLSPPSATVRVMEERKGPWVTLTVADQGPGIPPAFTERLFEEFAVSDVAHHTQGLGLSLAIARQIAEQHGGRLTAADGAACGAEFSIHLPAHDAGQLAA